MTDINSRQPEACARRAAPSPRDSRAAPVLPLTTCATRRGERREGGRRPIRSAVSPHLGPRISPFSFLLVVFPLAKQTRRASSMCYACRATRPARPQCSNPVVWFRLLREDNLSNLPLSLLLRRPITCTLHVAHYIFIRPAYACVIINSPIAHAECGGVRPQSRPGERCINRKSRDSSPHSHRKPPDVWRTSRPTPCATRHATVK